jgi:Fe-S cluster assembly iron-binding protein IscA
MLTLSSTAVEVIERLTSQPNMPEGSGLRLAPQTTPEGNAISLSLAESPTESDQVVSEGGAQVFVAEELAPELDDKLLDAGVSGEQISFSLSEQP